MSELLAARARMGRRRAPARPAPAAHARTGLVELDPEASEALRLAAVLHDIERAFPRPRRRLGLGPRLGLAPSYNRWHQDRCADIVADWLREHDAA